MRAVEAILEGITLVEDKYDGGRIVRHVQSWGVTESKGRFFGHSSGSSSDGRSYHNWYGAEMTTSSNLDLRKDGFESPEEAASQLAFQFGMIGFAGGEPIFKGGKA